MAVAPYTTEQLAAIKDHLARGVSSVELNGEKITFRSLDEMRQIIATIERELAPAKRTGFYTPGFWRG